MENLKKMLLIDSGNTFTKFGISKNGKLLEILNLKNSSLTCEKLEKILSKSNFCVLCSVRPDITKLIKKVSKKTKTKIEELNLKFFKKLIKYKTPQTLGSDRIANFLGAISKQKPPLIIIDIGSAITCDIVNKKGEFLGGFILPGVEMCLEALYKKTALLPHLKFRKIRKIYGDKTKNAILLGVFNALTGGIQRCIRVLKRKFPDAKVIVTGGGYQVFKNVISFKHTYRKNLTLEGLLCFAKILYNKSHKQDLKGGNYGKSCN
ncbi:MAG: type III pantothenate kinase [Elusimicrobia bacterium]|nr:type III pantothenate kinase [Elusimicrobiota bacterium]